MYIRTRLALWLLLILVVFLVTFSAIVFGLTRGFLLANLQSELQQRANLIAVAISQNADTSQSKVQPLLDGFAAQNLDYYLQVQDQQGTVLARSANLANRTLTLSRAAIAAQQVGRVTVGQTSFLVYGRSIRVNGQLWGYVLVGHPAETSDLTLKLLPTALLAGILITLVLAGGLVWLLVRRAMRPLEQLAATASEIAIASDHSLRLQPQGPPDEINRLAQTINGMLQSLEDAYKQVQEVNSLQRHFLADVSHELRTPLTIMLSSLDLLRKEGGTDPDFQVAALENIRGETERMARLVTQLLILARTDAGATFTREPLLVVELILEVCRQVCPTESGTILETRGLEQIEDAVVLGNADYLKQLFLILLENAFKYTPDGGRVEVIGTLNENTVTITIADTGIGITSVDLSRIFDRFYRADNARFRSGMGLGLSIARSIAEQHSGTITVESTVGEGSRFTVTLPLLNYAPSNDRENTGVPTHFASINQQIVFD